MLYFARTWNITIKNNRLSCIIYETFTPWMHLLSVINCPFPRGIVKNGLLWKQSSPACWWKEGGWTWFGFYILSLLGHLLPAPSACKRGEGSKGTTARPKITSFIPKPTEMFMLKGFSLRALITAALAEQTARDHQVPVTAARVPVPPGDQVSSKVALE